MVAENLNMYLKMVKSPFLQDNFIITIPRLYKRDEDRLDTFTGLQKHIIILIIEIANFWSWERLVVNSWKTIYTGGSQPQA